jgi:hypothetical protein
LYVQKLSNKARGYLINMDNNNDNYVNWLFDEFEKSARENQEEFYEQDRENHINLLREFEGINLD